MSGEQRWNSSSCSVVLETCVHKVDDLPVEQKNGIHSSVADLRQMTFPIALKKGFIFFLFIVCRLLTVCFSLGAQILMTMTRGACPLTMADGL